MSNDNIENTEDDDKCWLDDWTVEELEAILEQKKKLVDIFNVCLNDLGVNLKGGFSNDI